MEHHVFRVLFVLHGASLSPPSLSSVHPPRLRLNWVQEGSTVDVVVSTPLDLAPAVQASLSTDAQAFQYRIRTRLGEAAIFLTSVAVSVSERLWCVYVCVRLCMCVCGCVCVSACVKCHFVPYG